MPGREGKDPELIAALRQLTGMLQLPPAWSIAVDTAVEGGLIKDEGLRFRI